MAVHNDGCSPPYSRTILIVCLRRIGNAASEFADQSFLGFPYMDTSANKEMPANRSNFLDFVMDRADSL